MEGDTASLRKAAPLWTLAGDKQLLGMLQKIHQKIVTKCEEATVKLDVMVDALDNASIDLQNVNNKFMALSNSQFVESRVYDDDVDISTEGTITKVEPPIVGAESEITKLKRSLQCLEQMHEPVHILDSDSSDDEDNGSIILKPKDVYLDRPLPYIIGSQAWRNKWHAGLLQEESDSDSSVSKRDNTPPEEYSESEPETAPTDKLADRTISLSSMESEVAQQSQGSQAAREPMKPADIAAELARRLGGQTVQLAASEPVVIEVPEPTTTKVYKVEKPAPTTVFSDEPPPLDDYQSYKSDYTDDDDIFAELHRKPYPNTNRDQNRVAKDLFGGIRDNIVDDLFREVEKGDTDIGNVIDYKDVKPSTSMRDAPRGFDNTLISNSVSEQTMPKAKPAETKADIENTVKKPVGGISLFGSNEGTESIGAAILKRNQRKSTSDEEASDLNETNQQVSNIANIEEEPVNKIIKDLFHKPAKKKSNKEEIIKREESEEIKVKDKVDLFSDNLFDDIDDIFNTNIVTKPKDNKTQKSIFDDDDLFADITLKKPEKLNVKTDTKNIFDSDDDLFTENDIILKTDGKKSSNITNVDKHNVSKNPIKTREKIVEGNETVSIKSKSIFDDDDEDDIFIDVKIGNEVVNTEKSSNTQNIKVTPDNTINNDNECTNQAIVSMDVDKSISNKKPVKNNSFSKKFEKENVLNASTSNSQFQSPSVFDDDEFDDLFSGKSTQSSKQLHDVENNRVLTNIEDHKDTESIKPKHDADYTSTEVKQQLSDKITETKHAKFEIATLHDIIAQNNETSAERHISSRPDVIEKSKTIVPTEIIAANIEGEKKNTTLFLKNADISKGAEHLEHIEPTSEYVDSITLNTSTLKTANGESEITEPFSDLFTDLPPAFEKPVEPKKSKNVNALFDDDSDDEALFFKKNEGISDEKPDLNYNTDRFRIFHDEPPEIDVDFSQKSLKNTTNISSKSDDELFEGLHELQKEDMLVTTFKESSVKELNKSSGDKNLSEQIKTKSEVDITKLIEASKVIEAHPEMNDSKYLHLEKESEKIIENNSSILTDLPGVVNERSELSHTEKLPNQKIESESKKSVGKLKPINFNINVNSLLPGATLNKSKGNEEIDGQRISTKSNEELNVHSPQKTETKIVKSVSFDGDPGSQVLDNKFSKQRAKIQVKRRPSSRKARLEAVRKSGIDLTSDSTDNSSSFDEPPYKEIVCVVTSGDKEDLTTITQKESIYKDICKENTIIANECNLAVDIKKHTNTDNIPSSKTTQIDNSIPTKTEVKSKLVYILNDEDIFTNTSPGKEDNIGNTQDINILNFVDDNDELLFKAPNISTLGKTYENKTISNSDDLKTESKESIEKKRKEEKKSSKTKKSLFDDLSEDENELFGNKMPKEQKGNIFDSDSEGELFAKSKNASKSNVEVKKKVVQGSLFGDESDDDNELFGFKTGKAPDNIKQIPKPKETAAKTSEAVFEDPLSMFSNDS